MGYIKYGTIKDELPELYECLVNKDNGAIHSGKMEKKRNMDRGCFGDVWTWMHDEDIDEKVFRVRRKDSGDYYEKGKFLQVIELPYDFLIGILHIDDEDKGKSQIINFYLLSELEFYYMESDQDNDLE